MSRTVHIALVRVYGTASHYGETPFASPSGNPLQFPSGDCDLEVHFGMPPSWLGLAEARRKIVGAALLRLIFHGEPIREELDAELSAAAAATFMETKHNWLTALVLRRELLCADDDVQDSAWRWGTPTLWTTAYADMEARAPSIDLAARSLAEFLPNVFNEVIVSDRVYMARST